MAKLKFGAWIPTYAWGDRKPGRDNVRRIRASIEKCEKHGIDVWDIDHLLSAPGLYGHAWLERDGQVLIGAIEGLPAFRANSRVYPSHRP